MEIIKGGVSVDDRGSVSFVNDFDFKDVKRFYTVQNHSKGFVRAWHGHEKEAKYVYVPKGSALIATVSFDDNEVHTHVLSEKNPEVLYIPKRHFNGFKTLTDDTVVMFFSTSTLEESKDDDVRMSAKKWTNWEDDWR